MTENVFAPDMLAGRTVFITGGATGIGRGICGVLGGLGASIFIASRDPAKREAAVAEMTDAGIACDHATSDVRDYAQVEAAVAACVSRFGGLDILINNAAGNFICPTAELSPNGWKAVIDIDLNGTFYCCKAAYPHLKESGNARIVSISTSHARTGWPGAVHAGAAKAGIQSLTHSLAVEWAPDGILVNTVSPGPIAGTEGVDRLYIQRGEEEKATARVALKRFGRVDEIGNAVAYLCSPAGAYVTGTELVVDGGRQWAGNS
ncbi:MAG: SDR family oxidoreductase [Rhodospirillaceae bacterium]